MNRISEPFLPEHQLLREAGSIPKLSAGLRDRVLIDVRTQVRYGRWVDRLRIVAAVLAASVMVCLVWTFRWTGQEPIADRKSEVMESPTMTPTAPSMGNYSTSDPPEVPTPTQVPQGGPSSRPEMKELQQLNRLIEEIQGRHNTLCGLVPLW